jgi:5'-3' exonuclease
MFNDIIEYLQQIDAPNKPANMKLWARIEAIKGIGPKLADEIIEEYDNAEQIVKNIESGEFQVGGLGPKRKIMLLRALRE